MLKSVELFAVDFEWLIDQGQKGDFIFVDPPYTVMHGNNGFIKYNEKLFSWSDQERLAEALARAKRRGAKILATNAAHDSVRELYRREFVHYPVERASVISGKVTSRQKCEELIIHS